MKHSTNVPRVKFFYILLFLCLSLIITTLSVRVEGSTQKITFEFTSKTDLIKQLEDKLSELKETQSEAFVAGSANASVPEEILEELRGFYGGGPSQSPCNGESTVVAWCDAWSTQAEYYTDLIVDVCSATSRKRLRNASITLIRPDGKSILLPTESPKAKNVYYRAKYRTTLDDPVGTYRFQVRGLTPDETVFRTSIKLPKPAGPRMVWLADEQVLQLFGFKPNERVRIFAYVDQKLKGWRPYNVGPNGRLRIRVLDGYVFIAIGDLSGEAQAYRPGLYMRTSNSIIKN